MNKDRGAELRVKYGGLLDEQDPVIRAAIGSFTLCFWNRWKPGTIEYQRRQELRKQLDEITARGVSRQR